MKHAISAGNHKAADCTETKRRYVYLK